MKNPNDRKAFMSVEAYRILEENILKPTPPSANKTHEQLIWDECKRHIMACIDHNIQVVT